MNRGSDLGEVDGRSPLLASMRPRFMNRGSLAMLLGLRSSVPASMRPRFMNRGSVHGQGQGFAVIKRLQ